MDTPTFIATVRETGRLDSDDGATTVATLEILGERLTLGEAEDLAAHLSEEEGVWLVDRDSPKAADFPAEEFVERLAGAVIGDALDMRQAVLNLVGHRVRNRRDNR